MSRKRSFPPVVDGRTRLLMLGSLPGEASLAAGRYYAHPRNNFWRLMEVVLEEPLAELDYDTRLAALLRRGVGLWDTVAEAKRRGSADAAIEDAVGNDLTQLVRTLPRLEAVAFNGATSAALGIAQLGEPCGELQLIRLPSSSPAYAGRWELKAAAWSALRAYVDPA